MPDNIINKIIEQAKDSDLRIVLPEMTDSRVKEAGERLQEYGITPVFPDENLDVMSKFQDHISQLKFTDNWTQEMMEDYLDDPLHSGAVMVALDEADGMVAGAVNSSSKVIRTAIRIIGIKPESKWVSSNFLMISPSGENAITFTDCAVIPEPTPEQSAALAFEAALYHRLLTGEEPKIAFLSFSTKGSSDHYRVDRVKEAVKNFKRKYPEIICDGELQLDAALVPAIARGKCSKSEVKGEANVLVFPNLDAGNIAYKLTERLAGYSALGPLLQGLKSPVHDLSRGCSVNDIVNVAAITALQKKGIYANV